MITNVLIEHPWLTTVGLGVLVLLGPPVGIWLVRRHRLTRLLLVLSVVVVVGLTLAPTSAAPGSGCAVEWSVPFLGRVELVANIVLFVPAVALAAILTRRPLLAVLGGSAASVLVEAVQAGAPWLGRSCSTNDWLSNTIGAVLGAGIAAVALRVSKRHDVAEGDGPV